MTTLHTFGCSITQGYALPDVVRPLTYQQQRDLGREIRPDDVHVLAPSEFAWPAVLGHLLSVPVINHARRGACFNQIARQCAVAAATIKPQDTVIVMWTYLCRISLQWPSRTAVPFCHILDSNWGWTTRRLGFNRWLGLDRGHELERPDIEQFIRAHAEHNLNPMAVYDQYYRNLLLLTMTAGFLDRTQARVIHLSVEPQPYLQQLEAARANLPLELRESYQIPNPQDWYTVSTDHECAHVIFDPDIPLAENDQHPSVEHHRNFADLVYRRYFTADRCAASQP